MVMKELSTHLLFSGRISGETVKMIVCSRGDCTNTMDMCTVARRSILGCLGWYVHNSAAL